MKYSTNVSEEYVASIFKGEEETSMKQAAPSCLMMFFLIGLFFNFEDGGDMFLGNIG
jgi:hypothetical protein